MLALQVEQLVLVLVVQVELGRHKPQVLAPQLQLVLGRRKRALEQQLSRMFHSI